MKTNITIDGVELEVEYTHSQDEPEVGYRGEIEIESIKLRYPDSDIAELLNNKNPYEKIIEALWKIEQQLEQERF